MLNAILITSSAFTLFYAFYVGGRLVAAEKKVEILRAVLHHHLETGEDFRPSESPKAVLTGKTVGAW